MGSDVRLHVSGELSSVGMICRGEPRNFTRPARVPQTPCLQISTTLYQILDGTLGAQISFCSNHRFLYVDSKVFL
jgi:hypothetical protein